MASNLTISIDILLKGADQINKLAAALGNLKTAARGFSDTASAANKSAAAQERAESSALKLAQASARLQTAQGNLAGAMQTLSNALSNVNQQTLAAISAQTQLTRLQNRQQAGGFGLLSGLAREAGESIQQAGAAFSRFSQFFADIGRASVQSALQIDAARNSLRAFEGTVEAANKRLAELRKLALESPGLTFQVAASGFALLRASTKASDDAINSLLKSVGKLNAAFSIDDVDLFIRNLVQIFTTGFNRKDIKEALRRVPIFEDLIKSAFNVKNVEQLKTLQEAGQLTLDAYLTGLANAINTDPRLANVQESLSIRLQKLFSRVQVALEPLGARILDVIVPIIERVVPLLETLFEGFSRLPGPIQTLILVAGGLGAALSPALTAVGGFIQALQVINIARIVGQLAQLQAGLQGVEIATLGVGTAFNRAFVIFGIIATVLTLTVESFRAYSAATDAVAKLTVQNIEAQGAQLKVYDANAKAAQELALKQNRS